RESDGTARALVLAADGRRGRARCSLARDALPAAARTYGDLQSQLLRGSARRARRAEVPRSAAATESAARADLAGAPARDRRLRATSFRTRNLNSEILAQRIGRGAAQASARTHRRAEQELEVRHQGPRAAREARRLPRGL